MYTYQLGDSLYINLTNRCTNNCVFCIRNKPEGFGPDLWLDKEPTFEDVITEIKDPSKFQEIVFCGYGEPTIRLPQMLQICQYLKDKHATVRLNTNGQGSLIWGKNIAPELNHLVDSVSISLNAKSQEEYNRLCMPDDTAHSFEAVIAFAEQCKQYIPEVCLTVVYVISGYEIEQCRAIAAKLGVNFRVRRHY